MRAQCACIARAVQGFPLCFTLKICFPGAGWFAGLLQENEFTNGRCARTVFVLCRNVPYCSLGVMQSERRNGSKSMAMMYCTDCCATLVDGNSKEVCRYLNVVVDEIPTTYGIHHFMDAYYGTLQNVDAHELALIEFPLSFGCAVQRHGIFVSKLGTEFLCTICSKLLTKPVSCPKGHTFCDSCLTQWLHTNQSSPTCHCGLTG